MAKNLQEALPKELIQDILNFLPLNAMPVVSQVSKKMKSIADETNIGIDAEVDTYRTIVSTDAQAVFEDIFSKIRAHALNEWKNQPNFNLEEFNNKMKQVLKIKEINYAELRKLLNNLKQSSLSIQEITKEEAKIKTEIAENKQKLLLIEKDYDTQQKNISNAESKRRMMIFFLSIVYSVYFVNENLNRFYAIVFFQIISHLFFSHQADVNLKALSSESQNKYKKENEKKAQLVKQLNELDKKKPYDKKLSDLFNIPLSDFSLFSFFGNRFREISILEKREPIKTRELEKAFASEGVPIFIPKF